MNNPIDVIYEDNHLLIINKKGGILVQPDQKGDIALVDLAKKYLKEKYNKPGNVFCEAVHRLDRPVSGLVILAKTSKGLSKMTELFRDKKIQKTYWAIVKNKPKAETGHLVHWLIKNESKNRTTAYLKENTKGLKSELTYHLLQEINGYYLVEINPITGRPHQIRVQLASIGCSIKGDVKYGFAKPNSDQCINLHSKKVEFIHPIKNIPISLSANFPNQSTWNEFLFLNKI